MESMLCAVLPEAVPMEGAGKWVHMNKVEYDKLEWMKDLPPPSADDTKVSTRYYALDANSPYTFR